MSEDLENGFDEENVNGEVIAKKKYVLSPELVRVAQQVIAENADLTLGPARIKYMLVYPLISKKIAGKCVKAQPLVTFFGQADYVVQISGELWEVLDEVQRQILVYHELLHVAPKFNPKTKTYSFGLRDHDVSEFREVIDKHGIGWLDDVENIMAELNSKD
jgi:predicted metallopeptidase